MTRLFLYSICAVLGVAAAGLLAGSLEMADVPLVQARVTGIAVGASTIILAAITIWR